MSSTAEWRKLADDPFSGKHGSVSLTPVLDALRAACDRVDELEASISAGSRRTLLKRAEAAEAKLKVAVEALDTYAQFARNGEMTFVSGALAQGALAKLREGET